MKEISFHDICVSNIQLEMMLSMTHSYEKRDGVSEYEYQRLVRLIVSELRKAER